MSYTQGSGKVALQTETLSNLKERFGKNELEKLLQEYNVAGTAEALTEREAKYLLKFNTVDTIRNKFLAERQAGHSQVLYSLLQRESSHLSADQALGEGVTLQDIEPD